MFHVKDSKLIPAKARDVYDFIDDPSRFSSHMSKPSWMMGGGRMEISVDEKKGKEIGSHICLSGTVLGIRLALDEVIIKRDPPYLKVWETIGTPHLLVIGYYRMEIRINEEEKGSRLQVSIDYELPKKYPWLGRLFGGIYAKWCVIQMIDGTLLNFTK